MFSLNESRNKESIDMNNKRGGIGAKFLLVLILMIASAIGGAWAYRTVDAKFAIKDATREVEMVDTDDYDSVEANDVEDLMTEAKTKLEASKSRKDVYEILIDFKKDVSKIQTKAEKEAEAAKAEADEQRNQYNSYNNSDYGHGYDESEGTDLGNSFVNPSDNTQSTSGGDTEKKSILNIFGD